MLKDEKVRDGDNHDPQRLLVNWRHPGDRRSLDAELVPFCKRHDTVWRKLSRASEASNPSGMLSSGGEGGCYIEWTT